VNTYSRGNNSGSQRSTGENKGGGNTGTKSFNHTPQERTDSWGKKN